jgi:Rad3-related DNA helicase
LNTLCKTILAIYEKYPGKHIVYFPSYKYLEMAKSILEKEAHCVCQENSTSEKDYFLKHFFGKNEAVLGLAILGGALAEGVDFKGDALNSCLIVGTGMPQPSFEKEQLGLNLSQQGLNVFEYNFLIPGITRLIQTAGRLIRSEKDKGILVLIDPRFSLDQYCRYLPVHWNLNKVNTLGHGLKLIEEFAANEKV